MAFTQSFHSQKPPKETINHSTRQDRYKYTPLQSYKTNISISPYKMLVGRTMAFPSTGAGPDSWKPPSWTRPRRASALHPWNPEHRTRGRWPRRWWEFGPRETVVEVGGLGPDSLMWLDDLTKLFFVEKLGRKYQRHMSYLDAVFI